MQHNPNAWKKWHDPAVTEKDYERWREQHKQRLRARAIADIEAAIPAGAVNAPVSLTASVSGLSSSTIRNIVHRRKFGSRGPLHTTVLALRALSRTG